MPAKQVLFHDAARAKIVEGANVLADAVKVSLGPSGRNLILQRAYGPSPVAKTGAAGETRWGWGQGSRCRSTPNARPA